MLIFFVSFHFFTDVAKAVLLLLTLGGTCDTQVVFMKDMIAVLQLPPAWLKYPARFGTYFSPLDRRRPPATKLPRLFDQ